MLEFFKSLSAACCITLSKMNCKPECPHGWKEPAWPSLEHKDQPWSRETRISGRTWQTEPDQPEAKEGWCSCRAFRARESPALGVLKGLSPLHFKRCQCFYVLMYSLTQPASPGTGLLCHSVRTVSFFEQFGPFSPWIALPWTLQKYQAATNKGSFGVKTSSQAAFKVLGSKGSII